MSATAEKCRQRKVCCSECGYSVRIARGWIAVGLPSCPNPDCSSHGLALACEDPADAIECGLMSLDDLPRTVRTEVCRANGWQSEIIRTSPGRKSARVSGSALQPAAVRSAPDACSHPGCGKFVRRGEQHCAGHREDVLPF